MESVCFVEDLTAHGLLGKFPAEIALTEIPLAARPEEKRERKGFVPRAVSESEPLEA